MLATLSSFLPIVLKALGLIDWAKSALQSYEDKKTGISIQKAVENASTVQEAAHIQEVHDSVKDLTHTQLILQYAQLRAQVAASNSGH